MNAPGVGAQLGRFEESFGRSNRLHRINKAPDVGSQSQSTSHIFSLRVPLSFFVTSLTLEMQQGKLYRYIQYSESRVQKYRIIVALFSGLAPTCPV